MDASMKTSSFIQTKIMDEDSEIESVTYADLDVSSWSVSRPHQQVDKIIAYEENGPSGKIPYYAVYRHGEVYCRIPAHMVTVSYKQRK